MQENQKKEIINAAKHYMANKGISQNDFAKATKINVAYLSNMLKEVFYLNVKDTPTQIADKWFVMLADYIGYKLVHSYWRTQPTPQFIIGMGLLEAAKAHPQAIMMIAPTGNGKTLVVDKFCNENPVNTFRVTVGDHYKMIDIVNELCQLMGIPTSGVTFSKVAKISKKLADIKRSGGEPVVIFDEAENCKVPVFRMCKSIYDKAGDYTSIVLVGTPDLIEVVERGCNRGCTGMPQFKRRFKTGIHYLPPIDRTFSMVLSGFNFEPGLNKLLISLCENYGELHDYITVAMREADRLQKTLTENLFRLIFNLPKNGR